MATIALFGVTGYAGRHLAAEFVARGHEVIGVARSITPENTPDGVTARPGSIHDVDLVTEVARAADQIVVSLPARGGEGEPLLIDALPLLVDVAVAHEARLSFVGGAGSLLVAPGGPALIDTDAFPDAYKPEAAAHREILEALRVSDPALDWFYVSPAATFGSWNPGERTGTFRVGDDVMLTDENGESAISGADLAIAYADEIESGAHPRARIGVAY